MALVTQTAGGRLMASYGILSYFLVFLLTEATVQRIPTFEDAPNLLFFGGAVFTILIFTDPFTLLLDWRHDRLSNRYPRNLKYDFRRAGKSPFLKKTVDTYLGGLAFLVALFEIMMAFILALTLSDLQETYFFSFLLFSCLIFIIILSGIVIQLKREYEINYKPQLYIVWRLGCARVDQERVKEALVTDLGRHVQQEDWDSAGATITQYDRRVLRKMISWKTDRERLEPILRLMTDEDVSFLPNADRDWPGAQQQSCEELVQHGLDELEWCGSSERDWAMPDPDFGNVSEFRFSEDLENFAKLADQPLPHLEKMRKDLRNEWANLLGNWSIPEEFPRQEWLEYRSNLQSWLTKNTLLYFAGKNLISIEKVEQPLKMFISTLSKDVRDPGYQAVFKEELNGKKVAFDPQERIPRIFNKENLLKYKNRWKEIPQGASKALKMWTELRMAERADNIHKRIRNYCCRNIKTGTKMYQELC
ncbi:MAG: hypothetical protein ACE5OZ_01050 [Candidatus Heimdallarchaeota archaeon]